LAARPPCPIDPEEPQLTAPLGLDIDAGMFKEVAAKLFGKS
jgi:hypothetical protein